MSGYYQTDMPTNAYGIVNEGWDLFQVRINEAFAEAGTLSEQLENFNVDPFEFTILFNPPTDTLAPFAMPNGVEPKRPNIGDFTVVSVNPLAVSPPDVSGVEGVAKPGGAPTLDNKPNFDGRPQELTAEELRTPEAPKFDDVEFPEEPPEYEVPTVPELIELDLDWIEKPIVNLDIAFEGERPELDGEPPAVAIEFIEEEYQSELLDQTRAEIRRMMEDGTGMPVLVEQLLLDSAKERESVEANRAVHEAVERWTARGFSLPSGVLNKEVAKVRQDNSNRVSEMNREVFIQRRKEELENFRFAISQGIALENILIQKHLNVMARAFELARFAADLQYREFEARVAIFNARVQAFRVEAEVYRAQIEAERQKIDRYRALLESEIAKGEINKDRVAVYGAQVQGLTRVVELFNAEIEVASAQVRKNQIEAQVYSTQMQGYAQRISAKQTEFQGWATKIQGELGKVQTFEAETRGFLAKVQSYSAQINAELEKPRVELEIENLKVREFLGRLEHRKQDIEKEVARWQAESSLYSSDGDMYRSIAQVAASQAASHDRNYNTLLRESELQTQAEIQNWNMKLSQLDNISRVLLSALDSAGRSKSQLAAGAMSAVNLSAGLSESLSIKRGWNKSASFEGSEPQPW